MFGNSKELQSSIDSLKKELMDVTSDREKLFLRLEEAQNIIESFENEKKAFLKKNNEYKKEIDFLRVEHKANLDKLEKSVHYRVNTALASMGVDTFVTENFSEKTPHTDIEKLNTFNSLSGHEKTEYYQKNKAEITRALLSSNSSK